LYKSLARSWK